MNTPAERYPTRQVRAAFDATTITVYQAYNPQIAEAAVAAGTFVPPFSLNRMTWIKPSFLWMMYRCGWATKPGQERVLAVQIARTGFENALRQACLSHHDPDLYADHAQWRTTLAASPVRVQWDPERDLHGAPLEYRSLQVGLSAAAVASYVDEWVVGIRDITDSLPDVRAGRSPRPEEAPYPLPPDVVATIGGSTGA